ncbi:MAG: 2-dehydro-3-deoxygalactonokinase [Rhodobacteraceae bacterium]|nr:2-dehydro-3-deoxygalactonokinase [Paracoccaceae bacterium]
MTVAWIAADWGTTRLRVWAMDASGGVLASAESDSGMGALTPDAFEPALLALVGGWLGPGQTPVMICGMAGARQGWVEAPYRPVPCPPLGAGRTVAPTRDPRLSVTILPGLCQTEPPDVMRGEETQIAGFLAAEPGFSGTLCLPGTHAKWVRIAAGQVLRFRTAMTGELFALLGRQSVLRHSMDDRFDAAAFDTAVAEAVASAEGLPIALFGLRAAALLTPAGPGVVRARLSGLLIGAEIAATCSLRGDGPVTIIGADALARLYLRALSLAGVAARTYDGARLALAGLAAAREGPEDTP